MEKQARRPGYDRASKAVVMLLVVLTVILVAIPLLPSNKTAIYVAMALAVGLFSASVPLVMRWLPHHCKVCNEVYKPEPPDFSQLHSLEDVDSITIGLCQDCMAAQNRQNQEIGNVA